MQEFIQEPTKDANINGFVAGTLVHTDKGLVTINKIKVSDRVLSRDENNPDADGLAFIPSFETTSKATSILGKNCIAGYGITVIVSVQMNLLP